MKQEQQGPKWNLYIPSQIGLPVLAVLLFIGWKVFSSSLPQPASVAEPQFDESLWIVKAQESVRARLRDPASAEFRDVGIHRKSGAPIVCGQVNSRNGFGGKRGFQSFVFAGSVGTFLAEDMKAGEMKKVWQEMCTG